MRKTLIIFFIFMVIIPVVNALPFTMTGTNANLPDTSILPHKMASMNFAVVWGISNVNDDEKEDSGSNIVSGINVGLFDRGELGFILNNSSNPMLNLKYQLFKERDNIPQVTLGITNIFSGVRDDDYSGRDDDFLGGRNDLIKNSPYIAFSRQAAMITNIRYLEYIELKGTLGMGLRRFKGSGKIARMMNGFFFGINVKPARFLGISAEYCSGSLSTNISIYSENLTYQISVYQAEESLRHIMDKGTTNLCFNIDYKLDKFSHEKIQNNKSRYNYYKNLSPLINQKVEEKTDQTETIEELPLSEELQTLKKKRVEKEEKLKNLKKMFEEE